jgi:hypothetical protein
VYPISQSLCKRGSYLMEVVIIEVDTRNLVTLLCIPNPCFNALKFSVYYKNKSSS